jgi:hypothetical protein
MSWVDLEEPDWMGRAVWVRTVPVNTGSETGQPGRAQNPSDVGCVGKGSREWAPMAEIPGG